MRVGGAEGEEWVRGRCRALLGMDAPEWRESDTWILRLWGETVSRLGSGQQLTLVRQRCAWEGLGEDEVREAWERVSMLEAEASRG